MSCGIQHECDQWRILSYHVIGMNAIATVALDFCGVQRHNLDESETASNTA